jgi:two-component system KDP operon response regulator KdpE
VLSGESDGLRLDLTSRRATIDDNDTHLTATEFALLRVLATSSGAVTYRTLAKKIWGATQSNAAPRIRTHVANLRAKLDPGQRRNLIATEVGIGYRFTGRTHHATRRRRRMPTDR